MIMVGDVGGLVATVLSVGFRRRVVFGGMAKMAAGKDEGSWETVSVVGRDRLGA